MPIAGDRFMAKKSPTPSGRPPGETTISVKIWASVHKHAKLVAYQRDMDIADYLSMLLQKQVAADFKKAAAEIAKDASDES